MKEATKRAVAAAGGTAACARSMGVHISAVSHWLARGRIPATRVLELEDLIGAEVTRRELRPDVFLR